jgi:hypothetical protein
MMRWIFNPNPLLGDDYVVYGNEQDILFLYDGRYPVTVKDFFYDTTEKECRKWKDLVFRELAEMGERHLLDIESFAITNKTFAWKYEDLWRRFLSYVPTNRDYLNFGQPSELPWESFGRERIPTEEGAIRELSLVFWMAILESLAPEVVGQVNLRAFPQAYRFPLAVRRKWERNIRPFITRLNRFACYLGMPRILVDNDSRTFYQPTLHEFVSEVVNV